LLNCLLFVIIFLIITLHIQPNFLICYIEYPKWSDLVLVISKSTSTVGLAWFLNWCIWSPCNMSVWRREYLEILNFCFKVNFNGLLHQLNFDIKVFINYWNKGIWIIRFSCVCPWSSSWREIYSRIIIMLASLIELLILHQMRKPLLLRHSFFEWVIRLIWWENSLYCL
jgi:hypothetical protein